MKLISTIARLNIQHKVHKIFFFCCLLLSSGSGFTQTGQALDFDGADDRVSLPFVLSGSYTKEAWIKPTAASVAPLKPDFSLNTPNIISSDATALYLNGGKLSAGHAGGFVDVQDPEIMLADTWYHIAVSYNAIDGSLKLYKNGVLVDSKLSVSNYTETYQFLSYFFGNYFAGQMDEVRLWKSVRSESEILANKDCELTGDEPNLIAYYNFNQGIAGGSNPTITSLNDIQDKCTTPLNGTLEGFALTGSSSNWLQPGPVIFTSCSSFPNINITGNSICIANGDLTPSTTDFTAFQNFLATPVTRTFTIQNTGGSNLNISSVVIGGTNSSDFSISASPSPTVAGLSSTTFTITFNPGGTPGLKSATITVNNNDADESTYQFAINGTKVDKGKSLDFDGIDDEVSLPFTYSGSYTKEAWIKPESFNGTPNILSGTTALYLKDGKLTAGGHNNLFDQIQDPTPLPLINTWYHVALTYNVNTQEMNLYKNGLLVATSTAIPDYGSSQDKIGTYNGLFNFWGNIDQVRYWSVERSPAEIAASYNCMLSGNEPGLISLYNFTNGFSEENNSGITTLPDLANNAIPNNGTLLNFALTGNISNWVADSATLTGNCGASFPNITVTGNGNNIISGDTSPSVSDNTDFGSVSPAGTNNTFVISNTGNATLNLGSISFSGPDNTMFTVFTAPTATLAPGASTNLIVNFTPVGLGLKTATITINNDDPDEATFTFSIQGTGTTGPGTLEISNIAATTGINGSSTISWVTNIPASSIVNYGLTQGNLDSESNDGTLVTNHSVVLTGLSLGTSYYFRVTSNDGVTNLTFPELVDDPLTFVMPPNITVDPATQAICEGTAVTFTSTAISDATLSVQWQISTDNAVTWTDSIGATNSSINFIVSNEDNGKRFRAVWMNSGGINISDTAILTVKDTAFSVTNFTVCNNLLPYNWNGVDYTSTGTYTFVVPGGSASGCDSTATLNLTVTDTAFSVTNFTVCNNLLPYNWNGVDYTSTGTYTFVVPGGSASGCDSTATLNLTVTDTAFSVTNFTVCNNLLPYNWNGVDYTSTGTYTFVVPGGSASGCDSTATLNLTVTDTAFSVTNFTVCNNLLPYNWNGVDYTSTGTYTFVVPGGSASGCDSTATLNLTVTDTAFSVTNFTVCNNLLPYNWNGVDYTSTGTYTFVVPGGSASGCDSTATLNLTVTDTAFSVTNFTVCNNLLPYNWNGVDYTSTGTYTFVVPGGSASGCDSTATLNLTVTDTAFSVTNFTVCNNLLPYNWNGVDYTSTGTYTFVVPGGSASGCDSTATLNLTVTDTAFSVTNFTVCNNLLPYNWNGVDYTSTGTYTFVVPGGSASGCDSTATLNLTVTDTAFSVTNFTVCNNLLPYNWNGVDYTSTGTYTFVVPGGSASGCDSTATLNLTVTDTAFSVTNFTVCNNLLPYNWNGVDYTSTGTYTFVVPGGSASGCDSTATLNLTVTDTAFSVTNFTVCNNLLPYNWNGVDYTSTGTYTFVVPGGSASGCDSTATLNLTVTDTAFSVTNFTVCNNLLPYNWNGVDYTSTGTYTFVVPGGSASGCDSTATLNLTVTDTAFSVTNFTVCNNLLPYNWNGVDYTSTGTYTFVVPGGSASGCDSTATLNLTVTDTAFSVTNFTVCNNLLPYNWNGVDYTSTGTYTFVVPGGSASGCDSTATLNLTVTDTAFSVTNFTVCNNLLPYNWNGVDYTSTGTYTFVVPGGSASGCDSTATLNLTVTDTAFSVTNFTVCNNLLPYNWNGVDYTSTGTYTFVVPGGSASGCDSTATLNLTVTDTAFSVTNFTVCNNLLPYNWNGVDYTSTGTYTFVVPGGSASGCDSTATLNLTVTDTAFSVTNFTVCNNLLPYNWNGVDYTSTGTYTFVVPGGSASGCDSTATLNLTVTDTAFSVTNFTVCNNLLPYNWNGVDYTSTGTYTFVVPGGSASGCDSTATLNLTVTDTAFSVTNFTVCNNLLPYNWNGVDYTSTGTYTFVVPGGSASGCDSTATLNLTVTDTAFSVTNFTVCNNLLPYNWNGVDYTSTGTYTFVVPGGSASGCDSTATLNLTVTAVNATIVIQTLTCLESNDGAFTASGNSGTAPYEYSIDNGANWQSSGLFNSLAAGNYTIRVRDAVGCYKDSTIEISIEKAFWTGATSSDWHTASNWSTNKVPDDKTHVIIDNTVLNQCIISTADATAASVQAKAAAVVKVENNREIIISGTCTTLP